MEEKEISENMEVQNTFNNDSIDILVEDGMVENVDKEEVDEDENEN